MKRVALPVLAFAVACGDEESAIIRVEPLISVCAEKDAPLESCDRALDLGELPITVPHGVTLFVLDHGEGALIVSQVGGVEVTSDAPVPFTVQAGARMELPIAVTPTNLGAGRAQLAIISDDAQHSPYSLDLIYTGIPKPVPRIELCTADNCGTDIQLDLGTVRRGQRVGQVIEVHNLGTAPLEIQAVDVQNGASQSDEMTIATSTRAGVLPVAGSAELLLVYAPLDGVADQLDLVVHSNDPATPEARLHIDAGSMVNFPPLADARQTDTGSTAVSAAVEDLVVIDGTGSRDPEGDPLRYVWTLSAPARSRAQLDEASAARVSFLPDVAGSYRLELSVLDSLDQASEVAALVLIDVRPRFAVRARLSWQNGADLDLHLLKNGGVLFGADDCYFDNPRPNFGGASAGGDDPELRNDVSAPPGGEEIVWARPMLTGDYGIYVQYFDDGGLGAASATLEVVFDDASQPVLSSTLELPMSCALWHVADLSLSPLQILPAASPLAVQCR